MLSNIDSISKFFKYPSVINIPRMIIHKMNNIGFIFPYSFKKSKMLKNI